MEILAPRGAANAFRAPDGALGTLEDADAARLIAATADIALVVDDGGLIRDVAFASDDLWQEEYRGWLGRPWVDTVTVESRPKVEALLRDAAARAAPRWRHVNHPSGRGADLPVRYSAVKVGTEGRVVAIGRDLRGVATLQQRLVDAQQEMEREFAKLRSTETRYRLLFQIASEGVLIADASSLRISEANPAALELLHPTSRKVIGRVLTDLFEPTSQTDLQMLVGTARTSGRADQRRLDLAGEGVSVNAAVSLFRQESAAHLLFRLSPADGVTRIPAGGQRSPVEDVVEKLPDGFVVADPEWRVMAANAAFLDLVQLPSEAQARGTPLDEWIGRPGVEFGVLATNLRQHGSLRNFATVVRNAYGSVTQVELTAVAVPDGETPCYGFTVRALRRPPAPMPGRELPHSVEQLTELVGRVSLKDIVRESTDIIERFAIEAALDLTGDNRASAADMLGLSRQSLYVKLRRYGLGDLDSRDE